MGFALKIIAKNEQGARCRFTRSGSALSFAEVIECWQSPKDVETYLNGIKKLGFNQFYWEHPSLTTKTLDAPYECMVIGTTHFNRREVDTTSFSGHLHKPEPVVVFDNLGRNARLVVPTLKSDPEHYKHMGAFTSFAPKDQVHCVFNSLGKSVLEEVNKGKPIWLSTAGLGVIWLHIRLDTVPKYYKTKTYKNASFLSQFQDG